MEIYQLKTLLAVARCGHLTRAAEQLHLTQPAVSKQIKALEEELGVVFFERTPFGMTLTKSGQRLLPLVEQTLEKASGLIAAAARMRGELLGSIRLGTIIDPETLRLGEFLGMMLKYYPLIEIKLQHGISGWVLERLQADQLDAGYYLGKVDAPGVGALQLAMLQYAIVAPPEWAQQVQDADFAALAALPWIGTPPQSSQNRLVRSIFAALGAEVNFVIEADQEATMINLVRTGVGLCLMRADLALAAAERGEVCLRSDRVFDCPLSFIYPESRRNDPLFEGMLDVLRALITPTSD